MDVVKVALNHESHRWVLYVDGKCRVIDAAAALRLAKALDKADTESVGLSQAEIVRKHIRLDADAAEKEAEQAQERAKAAAEAGADHAFRARQAALAARAVADRLAPLAD